MIYLNDGCRGFADSRALDELRSDRTTAVQALNTIVKQIEAVFKEEAINYPATMSPMLARLASDPLTLKRCAVIKHTYIVLNGSVRMLTTYDRVGLATLMF